MSFEPGAPAPPGFVPLCVPEIRGNEGKYVQECLDTNFVSSVGPFVDRFEREFARAVGTKHAVAVINGTAAIHIALLLAGVQPDDEVILPSLTFIAPANAVRYVGAWPFFVDSEESYWQMDAPKLKALLDRKFHRTNSEIRNRDTGRRLRALLPVHILGHPVDIQAVGDIAREYDLALIEDATEALGAEYRGKSVGGFGDSACFSFNGNKLLTTGGGGMLVTDDDNLARRAKYLTTQAKDNPVEFIHKEVGYNYRLPNVQSAMGCAQLEQLASYVGRKREIAHRYSEELGGIPGVTVCSQAEWASSAFWMYTILVEESAFGMSSRSLMAALASARIQTRPLWQPLHLSPAHSQSDADDCRVAERLYRQGISLPCSVGLSDTDQTRVIVAIKEASRNSS